MLFFPIAAVILHGIGHECDQVNEDKICPTGSVPECLVRLLADPDRLPNLHPGRVWLLLNPVHPAVLQQVDRCPGTVLLLCSHDLHPLQPYLLAIHPADHYPAPDRGWKEEGVIGAAMTSRGVGFLVAAATTNKQQKVRRKWDGVSQIMLLTAEDPQTKTQTQTKDLIKYTQFGQLTHSPTPNKDLKPRNLYKACEGKQDEEKKQKMAKIPKISSLQQSDIRTRCLAPGSVSMQVNKKRERERADRKGEKKTWNIQIFCDWEWNSLSFPPVMV